MMKKLYRKQLSLTALALLLFSTMILAQQRTVSGKVSDEGGQPLPGVSVLVKGTSVGTVTDTDGKYSIAAPDNSTLVFSFIGYTAQEVAVGTQTTVDLQMQLSVTSLEEIVVVGYGEQKKTLVTGAISSVKADELATVSVPSIDQAISGRTAGVNIVPVSGQPGATSRIRIRGVGSNGNADPIFVIDGVRTGAGGMDYLNPNDIASVEILKDAASAAIYGVDAANGVILVTTKKGKTNTADITYDAQFVQQSLRDNFKLMDQTQYIDYLEEANVAGRPTAPDPTNPGGTDWMDVAFDPAPMQNHNLSFTGGTEKSSLLVSLAYMNQQGIAGGDKSKFERYSFRVNSNHKLKDWLNIGENFSFTNRSSRGLAENTEYGGVIGSVLSLDPLTPTHYTGALPTHAQNALNAGNKLVIDEETGQYFGVSNWITGEFGNPLITYQIAKGRTRQNKILGNIYAEIKPIKNLTFTTRMGVDAAFQRMHNWNPSYYYSVERRSSAASGNDNWQEWFTTQFENFATYDKTFADAHHLTLTAGTGYYRSQYNDLFGSYAGLFREQDKLSYPSSVPPDLDRIDGSSNTNTLLSYYGRLNYDFKNKYLLSFTYRRDASSMLADNEKWGSFPSASVGWVLSNEDFFTGLSETVSFAKLRASWGQVGSLANIDNGRWQSSISNTIRGPIRYANENGQYLPGAAPTQAPNPDLTWETGEQLNIGAELRFLNDNLTFTAEYFNKTTKNLISRGDPPAFVGIGIPFINAGAVENKGFELELGYGNDVGTTGLKYNISANFTSIKNEVTSLNAGAQKPAPGNVGTHWNNASRFEVGHPMWAFWGYQTAGIFQNAAEIAAYNSANGLTGYNPVPGDPIVVNTNGDNLISPADWVEIGSPHPTYYFGARVNLEFKGVDFLMFLQGQGGNDILMGFFRTDRGTANKPEFFYTDRWTPENPTNEWFRASTTGLAYNSDFMIAKGNFTKIRQLQLGYTLPSSLLETVSIKRLRVYVGLDNYFVFSKYKGFDPEVGSQGGNAGANTVGIDRGTYAQPKKVVGGLTLTF